MGSVINHFCWGHVTARMMLMWFKLLGLAPFSIQRSSDWKQSNRKALKNLVPIQFSSSPFGYVYNFGLSCICICTVILSIPRIYSIQYLNKTALVMALELTSSVFGNAALIMNWLIIGFRQKTAARLLNRLMSMDGVVAYLNGRHLPESSSRFITFLFITNIAIWVGLYVTSHLAFNYHILDYFTYTVASNILSWIFVQYTVTVLLIGNRFKSINRALHDRFISVFPEIPHGLYPATVIATCRFSAPKIATLRRAYISLCEISSAVSDFYSLPIVMMIAHFSFVFLYNAYYVIVPFVIMMDRPSYMIIANSLFWLSSHILPIIMLASCITNVVIQSRKTADIVAMLLTISNNRRDDNDELKLFSLELLHRKAKFSACGFFSLDSTIMYSIFGKVVTYLIILIQFQMGNTTNTCQQGKHNATVTSFQSTLD